MLSVIWKICFGALSYLSSLENGHAKDAGWIPVATERQMLDDLAPVSSLPTTIKPSRRTFFHNTSGTRRSRSLPTSPYVSDTMRSSF